ncbi:lytic transglycosylase domain-containing protein [Streptomyces shenzhenensis]|uniref:lytic transglycosylase domain-containing protein n=1 Tax=Streptomyces shenzhenensis TaxID=943815 RepID=UPI0033FDDB87
MSRPLARSLRGVGARLRTRRGLRGASVATCATVAAALLTAGSQAPAPVSAARTPQDEGVSVPGGFVAPDAPLPAVPSQGDDSYHVELPPLKGVSGAERLWGEQAAKPSPRRVTAEAGLPSTVFDAYQKAADSVGRTDPACGLRWELLAAIGKVESGHAGGGAVAANGDTLTRITGPALDGNGFALILDSENGVWDGDTVYDRAVGPMQFLPTTWKTWGADGNGDGVADPNNVYDAALAAGHYLCAGDRDLRTAAGLERAILSYNYSRDYLNLVLGWMEFYLRGVHTVPDGTAVVPKSPGAGGDTPATKPVRDGDVGGGKPSDEPDSAPGDTATPSAGPAQPTPTPSRPAAPSPSAGASTTPTPEPTAEPTPTGTPGQTPTQTPVAPDPSVPAQTPTESAPDPEPSTEAPASPTPTETTPEPTPTDTTTPAAGEASTGTPTTG